MDYHPNLKKLRSYWQFANVCQYFLMFYLAYGLENFETDEFESALITQDKEVITFYIMKLLRNINSGRTVNPKTWKAVLHKELSTNDVELPLPHDIPKNFFELTLFQQVVCLQYLTDLQFRDSAEKIRKGSEEEEFSQDWRVKPIGQDVKGNDYFLFDDNRLYLSKPQSRPPKSTNNKAYKSHNNKIKQAIEQGESTDFTWEPLCITLEDWEEFSQKFSNSRYEAEKDLHETLAIDILPKVIPELKYKIRRQRKLAETLFLEPKRSSRLQVKEALRAQKENEEKEHLQAFPENLSSPAEIQPKTSRRELRSRKRESISFTSPQPPKEESPDDLIKQLDSLLEGEWIFSCICGKGGKNFDDGTQQIACEKCGVWEHIKCQKFSTPSGKPLRNFNKVIFVCNRCKLLSQGTKKNPELKDPRLIISIPITTAYDSSSQDNLSSSKPSMDSNPASAELGFKNEYDISDLDASISKLLEDTPNKLIENDGLSSPLSDDSEKDLTIVKQNIEPVANETKTSSESETLTNGTSKQPLKADVVDNLTLTPDTKDSTETIKKPPLAQNPDFHFIPHFSDSEVSGLPSTEQTSEERPDEIDEIALRTNSAISEFSGTLSSNGLIPCESVAEIRAKGDNPSLGLPSDPKRSRCEPEEPWHDVSSKKTRPSI